eukprot:71877-Prorocentrum_lima.AAC.1
MACCSLVGRPRALCMVWSECLQYPTEHWDGVEVPGFWSAEPLPALVWACHRKLLARGSRHYEK